MPRTYRGRNRTHTTPRAAAPNNPEKFSLQKNLKKFLKKFLKQTAVALAVLLIVYITRTAAPNFWAQISQPIHETLEHNIDFVAIYNGSIGRLFPNIMINIENEDENESENDTENNIENEYEFDYNYHYDYPFENDYDFHIEAFEITVL